MGEACGGPRAVCLRWPPACRAFAFVEQLWCARPAGSKMGSMGQPCSGPRSRFMLVTAGVFIVSAWWTVGIPHIWSHLLLVTAW